MTYFPDLTEYTYSASGAHLLNVGWLAIGEPFPVGAVDQIVRDQLVRLAANPANVMRGLHYCDFCDVESPIRVEATDDPSQAAYLGTGEVHVAFREVVFAAPTLVVHYIDAHGYLPPADFCNAVRALRES